MAKLAIKKATTDVTVYLFIQASNVTTGAGLTGLTFETASLVASYVRPLAARAAITLATQTVTGAHSDGGFVEVDATNMPGVYRLDLPDAVCATGVPSAVVMLKGAANLAPVLLEIQLTDFDLNTAGVLIGATQGAITWGQQKIVANVAGEGALDITNINTEGGGVGIRAEGDLAGQYNAGSPAHTSAGQFNAGIYGVWNYGDSTGQRNDGSYKAVEGFDPALALEATLTAIKGVGWTNQTLVKIVTDISNISAGSGATPQQIWEYATRVLTAGTNIDLSSLATATDLATVDTVVDDIKLKTDLIPAAPAQAGEYTAAIGAIPTAPLLAANYTAPDNAGIAAIQAKTDQMVFTTPNKIDATATVDTSGLATSTALATVDGNVDAIKVKTDQMAFTVPNKIDASATVDPTGIATSEELEIIGDKVDDVLDKLNVSSVEFVTAVIGSTITILRGDTLSAALLNLGSLASYVSLDFTIKRSTYEADDDAIIRIRKNASGTGDGLLRLNGAAWTTGTDGSITITDAPTGDITITLKAGVTDDLLPGNYVYDVQLIEAAEVSTLTTGTLVVTADVTRLVA